MNRLDKLIAQMDTSELIQEYAPDVTKQQVQDIINYDHIHFEDAYPGFPVSNQVATVACPDHTVHVVQLTIDEVGSPKNHLCCYTCYDPRKRLHCAASVAAFIVKLAQRPPLQRRHVCPGCDEVLK